MPWAGQSKGHWEQRSVIAQGRRAHGAAAPLERHALDIEAQCRADGADILTIKSLHYCRLTSIVQATACGADNPEQRGSAAKQQPALKQQEAAGGKHL